MAEFPGAARLPAGAKLDVLGRLDPAKASEGELRGEKIFNGKGQCSSCHPAPYYTDNSMHNLRTERFYDEKMING
jgi:cytochrome c peroxidase